MNEVSEAARRNADKWLKIHAPHLWTRELVDNLASLLDAFAAPKEPILAPPGSGGEGGLPGIDAVDAVRDAVRRGGR